MEELSKQRFAAMVRIWIIHKQVIARNSHSSHYKNEGILKSFSKINNLLTLVKRDCREYNLSDLYRMLIINENDLRNILPAIRNPSYESERERLDYFLKIANNYKK